MKLPDCKTMICQSLFYFLVSLALLSAQQIAEAAPAQARSTDYLLINFSDLDSTLNSAGSHAVRARQVSFPLDESFQLNTAASQQSFDYFDGSFGSSNSKAEPSGIGGVVSSPEVPPSAGAEPSFRSPQTINNLIAAAARPEIPIPQQIMRTAMNSGL